MLSMPARAKQCRFFPLFRDASYRLATLRAVQFCKVGKIRFPKHPRTGTRLSSWQSLLRVNLAANRTPTHRAVVLEIKERLTVQTYFS